MSTISIAVFVLFVIFLNLEYNQHNVHAQSSCTTLRGETGVCVPILTCKTITKLLKAAPRPLPPSISQLVRLSHCGTFSNNPYACCEPNSVDNEGTTSTTSQPTQPTQPTQSTQPTQPTKTPTSASSAVIRPSVEKSEEQIQSGMNILDKTKCGNSDADRISNGEDANLSEFPWMALLVYFDGLERTLDCGGSLITERYVLTAAHCIRVGSKKLVSVRLGEHDTKTDIDCVGGGRKCAPPLQEIDVEEAIYHKDYNPSRFSDDIGLIRLVSQVIIRTNVKPVCLPITQESKAAVLNRMIIAGWGKVENGIQATVLQKAVVPIRENNYCQEALRVVKLTEKHLCAGGGKNKVDTCLGDSGGPIFYSVGYRKNVRYVQYGVVSGGSAECGTDFPSIFSRVEKYLPWIAGILNP